MLKPGTIVGGKYRLRYLLAEGGIAEVYLGEWIDAEESAPVAIKRLLPKLAANPIFADMFAFEASLTSSLHHKNIVACHEFVRDGNDLFMVMEFVLGKEIGGLTHLTKNWALIDRIHFAFLVAVSVGEALVYVHKKVDKFGAHIGIVHGDISPQNIMVNTDGEIKLYDFGAAKTSMSSLVFEEKFVRGNLRYMSPEQIVGEKIDARSDVFSLSLVILQIISSGSFLIERSDVVIKNGCTFDPFLAIPDEYFINTSLKIFFEKGLARSPDQRFSTSQEMLHHMRQVVDELPIKEAALCLREIMLLDSPNKMIPPREKSFKVKAALFLSMLLSSFALFVWLVVVISTDWFTARHRRNFPYWPKVNTPLHASNLNNGAPYTRKMGTLLIEADRGTKIYIDGKLRGFAPLEGINLLEGHYFVQLKNPDKSAVVLKMVKIYADTKTMLVYNF